MLTLAVLAVLVVGVVAGLARRSVEFGRAVSAAMSAWLSCVEFLLLRKYSRWCTLMLKASRVSRIPLENPNRDFHILRWHLFKLSEAFTRDVELIIE